MAHRIVDQIFERQRDRRRLTRDRRGAVDLQRDRSPRREHRRRPLRHHVRGERPEIDHRAVVLHRSLQIGEAQQLRDHPRGAVDLLQQGRARRRVRDRIGAQPDRRQRRAQLVRDIRRERRLRRERLLQPVERFIGRHRQRLDLGGQRPRRQPPVERHRPDRRGGLRGGPHPLPDAARQPRRHQRPQHHERQQQQHEPLEEGRDDVVGHHLGRGAVLRHHDPPRADRPAEYRDPPAPHQHRPTRQRHRRQHRRPARGDHPPPAIDDRQRQPAREQIDTRHRPRRIAAVSVQPVGDALRLLVEHLMLVMPRHPVEQRPHRQRQRHRGGQGNRDVEQRELPEQRPRPPPPHAALRSR